MLTYNSFKDIITHVSQKLQNLDFKVSKFAFWESFFSNFFTLDIPVRMVSYNKSEENYDRT